MEYFRKRCGKWTIPNLKDVGSELHTRILDRTALPAASDRSKLEKTDQYHETCLWPTFHQTFVCVNWKSFLNVMAKVCICFLHIGILFFSCTAGTLGMAQSWHVFAYCHFICYDVVAVYIVSLELLACLFMLYCHN